MKKQLTVKSNWIKKPWGRHKVLFEDKQHKVKLIEIKALHRTSLQYHELRTEEFYYLIGNVAIFKDDHNMIKSNKIKKNQVHRLENLDSKCIALILEIQHGICREEDIIRLEDDYGRIK